MGVEDAVDAAAEFIGPFVNKNRKESCKDEQIVEHGNLVQQALSHLQAINTADLAAEPDAPYDASLAGVVYGLLDFITTLGVMPHLSPGIAFCQRPRSVLTAMIPVQSSRDVQQLAMVIEALLPLWEQRGSGVQPLVSQRILPDIIAALAELSFSPANYDKNQFFEPLFQRTIDATPTSRLLPILTTFLQQPLPDWFKPLVARQLAILPLRQRGIRHMVEFLSLSYLSKHSQVSQEASSMQSQIQIPLEAVTQAARLLVSSPTGTSQDLWLNQLAPQLWGMLDGGEGLELSRVAGQIIAGGVLSKRATGAPGTVGWELFARPLIQTLDPQDSRDRLSQQNTAPSHTGVVLVGEQELERALSRLATIVQSYSYAGLLRRLIGPILRPMWALLNYTQARPTLNKKWSQLTKTILSRYMSIACVPREVENITTDLFWDGNVSWTFGPGSQGGVEIRQRDVGNHNSSDMNNMLSRIGSLDTRIALFVSLLDDAKTPDDVVGTIFVRATQRWLSPIQNNKMSLTDEPDIDPLAALTDAKLSEAMAASFKDQFARSPQHIMELMRQLLSNFVDEHKSMVQKDAEKNKMNRDTLRNLVATEGRGRVGEGSNNESTNEDLVSFAISILSTLVSSSDFQRTPATQTLLDSVLVSLVYLLQEQSQFPISPLIQNSANALLRLLQPSPEITTVVTPDPLAEHRITLNSIQANLVSSEPPDRTWALNMLRTLIKDAETFPVIDVPSMAHQLLFGSLADPETYVHIAAIPVLVDLAIRAPSLVVSILVDAFVDVDEQCLKNRKTNQTQGKNQELQEALNLRLRVGEVLNSYLLEKACHAVDGDRQSRHKCQKQISEACLSLANRRGKRTQTHSVRTQIAEEERKIQEEGEAAWGGPIPNLLDLDGEERGDQTERDELLKIVHGWEDTGMEEDVRIRTSALSVLSTVLEHPLTFLRQATVDAAVQISLLVLTMETGAVKGILRRAAMIVIIGLLRSLNDALDADENATVEFSMRQQDEVARIVQWVRDEDVDALVREHAVSALEGLETLQLKPLYKLHDGGIRLGGGLNLEGGLRGLKLKAHVKEEGEGQRKKVIVEEVD